MCTKKATQDSTEETLKDVQKLIYKTVHEFCAMYKTNFDEMLSEAYLCFMNTIKIYDPQGGRSFSTHLRQRIWFYLFNTQIRKSKQPVLSREWDEPETRSAYGFVELLDELNQDAQTIVNLILNSPMDLVRMMDHHGGKAKNAKTTLYAYLQKQGWDKKRIEANFNNITTALGY
jgi:DNA-directed RNA polymerase specialized sigma subunit